MDVRSKSIPAVRLRLHPRWDTNLCKCFNQELRCHQNKSSSTKIKAPPPCRYQSTNCVRRRLGACWRSKVQAIFTSTEHLLRSAQRILTFGGVKKFKLNLFGGRVKAHNLCLLRRTNAHSLGERLKAVRDLAVLVDARWPYTQTPRGCSSPSAPAAVQDGSKHHQFVLRQTRRLKRAKVQHKVNIF